MTDNQEKEIFKVLATLVNGVQKIQDTQGEHSQILSEHSQILNEHSQILNEHSQILSEHSQILNKHSQILNDHSRKLDRLEAKTDTIAEAVMKSDRRLTNIETEVEILKSGIH